jgi:hypothetical protein
LTAVTISVPRGVAAIAARSPEYRIFADTTLYDD